MLLPLLKASLVYMQVPATQNVDALSLLGYTLGTSGDVPKHYYLDVAFTGNQVSASQRRSLEVRHSV